MSFTTKDVDENQLRVAIIGGSLGGLNCAQALRSIANCNVKIFERSDTMVNSEGAGLWVQPEFESFMARNNISNRDSFGVTPKSVAIVDTDGKIIFEAGWRGVATSWDTLYRAYRSVLPNEVYFPGHNIDTVKTVNENLVNNNNKDDEGTVTLYVDDGRTETFDLIVFSDGAASKARPALLNTINVREEEYSGFGGYYLWRAMLPEEDIPSDIDIGSEFVWYYLRQAEGAMKQSGKIPPHVLDSSLPGTGHFIMYPVPGINGELEIGKRRLMWAWYVVPGVDDKLAKFDEVMLDIYGVKKSVSVSRGAVRPVILNRLKEIANKVLPANLAKIVNCTVDPYPQALVDTIMPQMAFQRMCIIGDAAFAARPVTGAGTTKAVINGIELARHLKGVNRQDVVEALKKWEPEQLAIGNALVARGLNAVNGINSIDSAFPTDYKLGKLLPKPPFPVRIANIVDEYLKDPMEGHRIIRRVYDDPTFKLSRTPGFLKKEAIPGKSTTKKSNAKVGFNAAINIAARGANDMNAFNIAGGRSRM